MKLNVWRLHPNGVKITKAEKTLNETAHPAAIKFCQPYTNANQLGWWIFPPQDIDICWHGDRFEFKEISPYLPTDHQLVSSMVVDSDLVNVENFCPQGQGRSKYTWGAVEPNVVQIWTGCVFQTPPGWNLLLRSPINFSPRSCYVMEGILETDWMQYDIWINLVFTKEGEWIKLRRNEFPPLAQIIPTKREDWEIDRNEILKRDEKEANRVFEFWLQYNNKKFGNGGKQYLAENRTKDSTTYHKERKRILDDNDMPKQELMQVKNVEKKKITKKFIKLKK